MAMKSAIWLSPLVAMATAACQHTPPPAQSPPSVGECDRDAAEKLVGRNVDDAQIRAQTGATSIRRISPGDAVTMDYRPERITIEIDPTSGKIQRASCG